MHGISQLLSHHNSHDSSKSSSSSSSSDTRHQDTRFLQELLNQKHEGKLCLHDRHVSRGSVSSTYSYGSSSYGSSHGSNASNHGTIGHPPFQHGIHHHSVYHTIHGSSHHHQSNHHHHPLHHVHHHHHHHHHHLQHHQLQAAGSGRASPTSPSPTNEQEKQHHHHHHHSIQEMIRQFGRRLGHIRRQSECQEAPRKKEEDFRNRSQSLDGGARHPSLRDADCETTYRIYESILKQGNGEKCRLVRRQEAFGRELVWREKL